jgi:hypothetical protein
LPALLARPVCDKKYGSVAQAEAAQAEAAKEDDP